MSSRFVSNFLATAAILLCATMLHDASAANAQQTTSPLSTDAMRALQYGAPISIDNAKKAAGAAIGEARKNKWTMAVAIVDPNGTLVYYEKLDNTQIGSAQVSIDKARSAALFKRPTKAFEDIVAQGGDGVRYLKMEGVIPIEGGIPLVMDGKIVGAIGMSGGASGQDAQCAQIGADSLK
jgi:glc operon protein GlcG